MFITNNLLNQRKGTRIRWQNRQAILDGLGQGQAIGDGAERDFAEEKVTN